MSRLSLPFATCRATLAIVFVMAAWTASGCLAPAVVTTADKDTTESRGKSRGTPLTPAKIVANEDTELPRLNAPEDPTSAPSPVLVEAIPLPVDSAQGGRESIAGEPADAQNNLPNPPALEPISPHWRAPQANVSTVPMVAPSESARLPAAEDSPPSPSMLVVSPYLGPPTEPFTPAVMAPPPHFFSVAQDEAVPPPLAAQFSPPAELLPANPLPSQPGYAPGYLTQQPVVQPLAPPEQLQQPSGQLGTVQRIKSIQQISLNIAPPALFDDALASIPLPNNVAGQTLPMLAEQQPFRRGELIDYGIHWQPAPIGLEFCYQPLYFEEVNLERYGRSWGILQPAVSAFNFYRQIHRLPYYMFSQPARRCTYHAHWALPGYRIPCREPKPLYPSVAGAMAESAWVYGMLVLIP
jgi:hypothetical protein